MITAAAYRGQPVVALAAILGGWIAIRATMWAVIGPPTFIETDPAKRMAVAGHAERRDHTAAPDRKTPPESTNRAVDAAPTPAWSPMPRPMPAPVMRPALPASGVAGPAAQPKPAPVLLSAGQSVSHQLLWMAAVSHLPLPAALDAIDGRKQNADAPQAPAGWSVRRAGRWSADGWLMLRSGGASLAGGPAPATYGASQAGAVVRYKLAPASRHRPAAYLRATAALNGSGEREVALGLSARPIAALPVIAGAEMRATRTPRGTRLRPAIMAVTEIAPVVLPLETRAEAYAQAGYVGGRFATAFADGQLRVDREVARIGKAQFRAGAGAWGGAQKGASRMDIGPTATVGIAGDGASAARLGMDWRFRVTGNAAPSSGPALTLSAGF